MAEATLPRTRSGALDLLAGRLRAHYGERLRALYALPDDPYEPQGEDPDGPGEALHVIVVLADETYAWPEAQREANRVGVSFDQDLDFRFVAMLKVLSASETDAQPCSFVKRDGVPL